MIIRWPRFLDLVHAGEVAPGEIDDYIDGWHAGHSPVPLHVHLGLTWDEYRSWFHTRQLPTITEHALARADSVLGALAGEDVSVRIQVHPPQRCRPPCPVHWPSDHPLAGAPISWDPDEGIIRRICRHGVRHPDPDDQQVRLHLELGEHDCDHCCTSKVIDSESYEAGRSLPGSLYAVGEGRRDGITRRPR